MTDFSPHSFIATLQKQAGKKSRERILIGTLQIPCVAFIAIHIPRPLIKKHIDLSAAYISFKKPQFPRNDDN